MKIDARSIPDNEVLVTDVCIIGAGPAGITLAHEFMGEDFQVCLLESGGAEFNDDLQELNDAKIVGDLTQNLKETRCRQFGGAANRWKEGVAAGTNQPVTSPTTRTLPLSEIDFKKRDWIAHSGWPFSRTELMPFYERAQYLAGLKPLANEGNDWEDDQNPQLPFAKERIKTVVYQFTNRGIFLQKLPHKISQSKNITIYLNANVTDIETNDNSTVVRKVKVACLEGNKFWVNAKIFILATGGIENARLLLLSNKTQNVGLGNQNDLVGRFFMEHPGFPLGEFAPSNRQIFNSSGLYDLRCINDKFVQGRLTFTEEVQQREQLLNCCLALVPLPKGYKIKFTGSKEYIPDTVNSLNVALSSQNLSLGSRFHQFSNALSGIDDIASYFLYRRLLKLQRFFYTTNKGSWSTHKGNDKRFSLFEVIIIPEQPPDPDIRVELGAERDRLGLRKVKPVSWSWSALLVRSILRTQEIFEKEVFHSGLGNFKRWNEIKNSIPATARGGAHHMGTTRMHPDPKQGVVDENCKVHSIPNLFVTGSSVFPTVGFANPTLTIIALAIRLADRVKQVVSQKQAIG